jgi:DNA repair exonuclease SbcCD nuclease subunit
MPKINLYGRDLSYRLRKDVGKNKVQAIKKAYQSMKGNPTIKQASDYFLETSKQGRFTGYVGNISTSEIRNKKGGYKIGGNVYRTTKDYLILPSGERISLKEANRTVMAAQGYNRLQDMQKKSIAKSIGFKGDLKAVKFELLGERAVVNPEVLLSGVNTKAEFEARAQRIREGIRQKQEEPAQYKKNYAKAIENMMGKNSKAYKMVTNMSEQSFMNWYHSKEGAEFGSIDYIYDDNEREDFFDKLENGLSQFMSDFDAKAFMKAFNMAS